MDNKMDQNSIKVEICRRTKFHDDNQTIVNSPSKNDNQFVVLQMVSPIFPVATFSMTKIIPAILLYREKNKYKCRNGGRKKMNCVMQTVQNVLFVL